MTTNGPAAGVCPFPDWAGREILEGDVLRHPSGEEFRVVRHPEGTMGYRGGHVGLWRAFYERDFTGCSLWKGEPIGLGRSLLLQVGSLGQAVVVERLAVPPSWPAVQA
jgi:hypothetical protein